MMKSILSGKPLCLARSFVCQNVRLIPSVQPRNASSQKFEEVQIKVPWGYIAGKWFGPKNVRPILCMHGWQDNAGTFDTLLPLLPNHIGYLSIDLPGHGKSSHFPPGMTYSTMDYMNAIEIIRYELKWDRVSLLTHSFSSQLAFSYTSILPDACDMVVGIDSLKPLMKSPEQLMIENATRLNKMMVEYERLNNSTEPPSYTWEEHINRQFDGQVVKNSFSKELAAHLVNRNIQPSTNNPDKYIFQRDNRIKYLNFGVVFPEMIVQMARRIIAPYLFIKATDSPYFEEAKYYHEALEVLKEKPSFTLVNVKATHHLHLTDPTKISQLISDFINKYRPPTE